MNEPVYKPNQWVLYELESDAAGFGLVVGALFNDGNWKYHVKGAASNEHDYIQVPEEAVKFILENGNWTAPQNFGGANSAYAAGAPAA